MTTEKRTRAVFIYMDPKTLGAPEKDYAQCSTCMMWTGPKTETCTVHGPDLKIPGLASCALYIHGKAHEGMKEMKAVVPEQSEYGPGAVRCENCAAFSDGHCDMFKMLMKDQPEEWDLDTKVAPKACCNAFWPVEKKTKIHSLDQLRKLAKD